MAILNVLKYPDENLHIVAQPVESVNGEIKTLISDMFETMYSLNGVGLAATQVDFHVRVVVIDVSEEKNHPQVFINPEIIASEGEIESEEGCLSVPGVYEKVVRAAKVKVSALDENGQIVNLEADGLLAKCIQHEIDHLNGKVFVEYLSRLKLNRIKSKLLKQFKKDFA
ncbi:MAG: peptide deformylase [Neisseriaceae bacterium]|nr:MAG: peptide deformylase [Neisseriaceae bacterium]